MSILNRFAAILAAIILSTTLGMAQEVAPGQEQVQIPTDPSLGEFAESLQADASNEPPPMDQPSDGDPPTMESEAVDPLPVAEVTALDMLNAAAASCMTEIEQEAKLAELLEDGKEVDITTIPACVAHGAMKIVYWNTQAWIHESKLGRELAMTLNKENLATITAEKSLDQMNAQHEAAKLASATAANLLAAEIAAGKLAAAKADNELMATVLEGELAIEKAENLIDAEEAIDPVTPMTPTADVASDIAELKTELAEVKSSFADIMSAVRAFCTANPDVTLCKAVGAVLYLY